VTRFQKLLSTCLPKAWAAAIEAESRAWAITCQKWWHESNVRDAGGVRWKAAGNPVKLFRCPTCGPTMHQLHKKGSRTDPANGGM
jgi:hypothetical protein